MKRIILDFRAPPPKGNRRLAVLLSLLAILLVVWLVILHNETQLELRRLQSVLAKHRGANEQVSTAREQGSLTAQWQRAGEVIEQLSFPWGKLLMAIEGSTTEDVALLSIQPDLAGRTIALHAEAKDWDGMVNYVKQLEASGFFSDVHVVSHEIQQSDPQQSVRFKLACVWDASLTGLSAPLLDGKGQRETK